MIEENRESRKFWKKVIGVVTLFIYAVGIVLLYLIGKIALQFGIDIGSGIGLVLMVILIFPAILANGAFNKELDRRLPLYDDNVGYIGRMRNEINRSQYPDE